MTAEIGVLALSGQLVRRKIRLKATDGSYEDLAGRIFSWAIIAPGGATVVATAGEVAVESGISTCTVAFSGEVNSDLLEGKSQAADYRHLLVEIVAEGYRVHLSGRYQVRRGADPDELPGDEGVSGGPSDIYVLPANTDTVIVRGEGADGRSAKQVAIDNGDLPAGATDADFDTWLRAPSTAAAAVAAAAAAAAVTATEEANAARDAANAAAASVATAVTGGLALIGAAQDGALTAISEDRGSALTAISDARTGAINAIGTEGDSQEARVIAEGNLQLGLVGDAGDAQLADILAGGNVQDARLITEGDTQVVRIAGAISRGVFPDTTKALSNGAVAVSFTAGSGGTPGTYSAVITGGGGSNMAIRYRVSAGGAIDLATILSGGYSYTGAPGIALTGSGLGGGAAITVMLGPRCVVGDVFQTPGTNGAAYDNWRVDAGPVATQIFPSVAGYGAQTAQGFHLAKARYDQEVGSGLRNYPVRFPIHMSDGVYTGGGATNSDGTWTLPAGATWKWTAPLNTAPWNVAGDKFIKAALLAPTTGALQIKIGSGGSTLKAGNTTTEPSGLPGVYAQTWDNSTPFSYVDITLTNVSGATISGWPVEIREDDSAYLPELLSRWSDKPVAPLPVRSFEMWRNWTPDSLETRRTLERLIDYAIDPAGNDNTGTGTIYAPWQTISKLPALTVDGKIIGFRQGPGAANVWREGVSQLTSTSAKGLTFTSFAEGYGNDPLPQISALFTTLTGDWTAAGDGTYDLTPFNSAVAVDNGYDEMVVVKRDLALVAAGKPIEAETLVPRVTAVAFTASITGDVMTVTAVSAGKLAPGQVFTGSGVAAGRSIVAQLTNSSGTMLGNTGTYSVSAGADLTSRAMAVTGAEACRVQDNSKFVGISGTTVSIKYRPPAGKVIGTDIELRVAKTIYSQFYFVTYQRSAYINRLHIDGAIFGYGGLAVPDRTFLNQNLVTGCRTHLGVVGGGVSRRSVYWAPGEGTNGLTFYSAAANLKTALSDDDFFIEIVSPLYAHTSSGSVNRREVLTYKGGMAWLSRRSDGARWGVGPGADNVKITEEIGGYQRGFAVSGGMGNVSVPTDRSTRRGKLILETSRYRGRRGGHPDLGLAGSAECLVTVDNWSDPENINNRSIVMMDLQDSCTSEKETIIAYNSLTATSAVLHDYGVTVYNRLGTIVTKPIVRRNLIICAPQLNTIGTVIGYLLAGNEAPVDTDENVYVWLKGAGPISVSTFTVGGRTGFANWQSYSGQDANSVSFDFTDWDISVLFRDFYAGDMRLADTPQARDVRAACLNLGAGCPWTIDHRQYEPGPDEAYRLIRLA